MAHPFRYLYKVHAFNVVLCAIALVGVSGPVFAAACPGNPDALGTSRVVTISPKSSITSVACSIILVVFGQAALR